MIIVVATFFLILGLILGAYWLFVLRIDQSDEAALHKRLRADSIAPIPKKFRLLKPAERLSHMSGFDRVLGQMGRLTGGLQRKITQAGLTFTVGTLLLAAACCAVCGFVVVKLLTSNT